MYTKRKATTSVRFCFLLTPGEKRALESLADKYDRSERGMLRQLIQWEADRHGIPIVEDLDQE